METRVQHLAFLVAGLVSLVHGKCEGVDFYLLDGYCYSVKTGAASSFEEAETICNEHQASLASIHSEWDNSMLGDLIYEYKEALIGLRSVSGSLQWNDGSIFDFNYLAAGVTVQPTDCVKLDISSSGNNWYPTNCKTEANAAFMCKKKPVVTPNVGRDECPSADTVYSNAGMMYSPGYPETYEPPYYASLECSYRLKGNQDYKVVLEIENAVLGEGDSLKIYEGSTDNENNLLSVVEHKASELVITTKTSNMMFIKFYGAPSSAGIWRLGFYTEPLNPPTQDPLFTTPSPSSNCPAQNVFGSDIQITSPNFPFAYSPNSNCMYYLPLEAPYKEMMISVLELNMASDDYIDFIDQRSNFVFASTKASVKEGYELLAQFPVAINFRSGKYKKDFAQWRLAVERIA